MEHVELHHLHSQTVADIWVRCQLLYDGARAILTVRFLTQGEALH